MVLIALENESAVYSLHLRIDVSPTGDWQISLGHRDARPEGGHLDIFQVAALQQAIQDAADVSDLDPLLRPDSDLDQVAAERRIGQSLSNVLNANTRLTGLFSYYLGQSDRDEQELLLAVDVSAPELRALPWELLCRDDASTHLERQRITIARLGHGLPRPSVPPRGLLQTLYWCPQPEEPISASLLQTLDQQTHLHHLPAPVAVEAGAPEPDAVVVLHLICHGRQHHDQLVLLAGESARDVDGPLQQLLPILPSADLVVLSICESAATLPSELEGLVGQLISGGARAVVAPSGPLAAESVSTFLTGLYSAITQGASLTSAVGAGRRAVRAMALPYPDARWGRLQLTLSSLQPPRPLLWIGWCPTGWPRPDQPTARMLQRARELGEPSGFVGIEHILMALAEGDLLPAATMMRPWRFGEDAALVERLLLTLRQTPPRPSAASRRQLLSRSLPDRPAADRKQADWLHREHLGDALLSDVEDTALTRLAWGLEALRGVGNAIEQRQRQPWADRTVTTAPTEDTHVAAMWQGWFCGDPWALHGEWEALFVPIARRAFITMLEHRGIPRARQNYILSDVLDSATTMMMGSGESSPGWMELAVRVLEGAPPSPVTAMARQLDPRGWRKVSLCAVRRGYGPASARVLYPNVSNPVQAARLLAARGMKAPAHLDTVLDLHVACRLLDRWSEDQAVTCPERNWQVVKQNRGRARARLRAVLAAADPTTLQAPLLALDGLADRTRYAMRRYCRDWAWIQLARHFPFHCHTIDARCNTQDDHPPMSAADRASLKSWVLLVILKGRLAHLERWIHSGGTGDRDATWGRLQKDLPDRLRELDTSGRMQRGLPRLRAELAELLPAFLAAWNPVLVRLSALSDTDALIPRFNTILDEIDWQDDIPRPGGRYFMKYSQNAAEALTRLKAAMELA